MHFIQIDEERKGRMGGTEVVFAVAESKRQVKTGGDWSSAYRRMSKAVTFLFPTVGRNYQNMLNISRASSPRNMRTPIPKSSCTISQSAIELEEARMSCSPTTNVSAASARPYCTPMELSTEGMERGRRREVKGQPREAAHQQTL